VSARQDAQAGGIDSLKWILGLLESLKIQALVSAKKTKFATRLNLKDTITDITLFCSFSVISKTENGMLRCG
jgi:hypothetical protein